MHEYYAKNKAKIRRTLKGYLKYIASELEAASKLSYDGIFEEIWAFYEKEILEDLPFIGGDESSGTASLTSAYLIVATGEVMKRYGVSFEESNKLLYIMYKRYAEKIPGIVKPVAGMLLKKPWLVQKIFKRIDKQNAVVAKKYPGCFRLRPRCRQTRARYSASTCMSARSRVSQRSMAMMIMSPTCATLITCFMVRWASL